MHPLQVLQDAAPHDLVGPSTIAAVLGHSVQNDIQQNVRQPNGHSSDGAVPLSHCSNALLGQLKHHTPVWAQRLDQESASVLAELCLRANLWQDVTAIFQQRLDMSEVRHRRAYTLYGYGHTLTLA